MLWHLSENGAVIDKILVRESLNNRSGAHLNNVAVVADEDSTYVASSKMDWPKPVPVEVSRVTDGQVAWSKLIPETVKSSKAIWVCPPALSIIDDGDVILACAVGEGIDIYHFEKASGQTRHLKARLPECTPNDRIQQLFITRWKDDKVIIAGSRSVNNVADGCSWAGLISWP